jgi:hypothetical protein
MLMPFFSGDSETQEEPPHNGYTQEIITTTSQGGQIYQKKVVEEGPGYVHVQVMQAATPNADGSVPYGGDGFMGAIGQIMEQI